MVCYKLPPDPDVIRNTLLHWDERDMIEEAPARLQIHQEIQVALRPRLAPG
ncbi:MAG: hypothetical protein GX882_01665, partial [Methanomicrobiales archaeon]|nr:hypothetical protein [Methanomicrobiales archaeon]